MELLTDEQHVKDELVEKAASTDDADRCAGAAEYGDEELVAAAVPLTKSTCVERKIILKIVAKYFGKVDKPEQRTLLGLGLKYGPEKFTDMLKTGLKKDEKKVPDASSCGRR